ncbi:MAG: transglutaminase-like domain-containing protein [Planctomycetes bacterium]|nr:transglutaminase-like domain-containing protein [Planctomycetota bacterium]
MAPGADAYVRDVEFTKLLRRQDDVDVTVAALELSRDARPDLDFGPTLDWIAARAAELRSAVARARTERAALEELIACLTHEHGLAGDEAAYDRPEGSFIDCVVQSGRGIPISLSVVYMAVARQVGLELEGASAPMHFLTRLEAPPGPLFLDAYGGGRILDAAECTSWLKRLSRLPVSRVRRMLKGVDARTIIIRMLNNLKALYVRTEAWPAAWIVQRRLTALEPAAYHQRRDLALLSIHAQRPGQAIDLLESCLKSCPDSERDVLAGHLDKARRQLVRWN